MNFSSRPRRQSKKKSQTARLQLEFLESRDLLSNTLADQILALVPTSAVTAQVVQNGNWSSPTTWRNQAVPSANANVLIPSGLTVNVDTTTNAVHTIRVDGTLQFAANLDTNLLVDTLVVNANGNLYIGRSSAPIGAGHLATITFTANGPINTAWDPTELSRGLLALGTVTMYGATTTPFVTLAGSVSAGSTTLALADLPTNWHVGDEIVLGGTYTKWNQDEDLRILAISGKQITVSPLKYDHTASNGVPVYLADVTRNVVLQSQDQTAIGNRGHVLVMCADMTNIHYAEFLGLDRTNKSLPVNDPQLDANGNLIPGTGTNPRGRYAVNVWESDSTPSPNPGVVDGSTVVNSPGWGFVNHSSNVNFTNDVAFNVNGASFVSEAGDETGSFANDLAIHSLGTGNEVFYDPVRVALQDWAHEGEGFWMQGNGVSVQNNVAIGQAAAGYYYFFKPYTLPLQNVIPSTAPLTGFHNNLAEEDHYGVYLRYETNGGTIDGLTAHDCKVGYTQEYCTRITLQNSHLYGTPFSYFGIMLPVESAQGFVASNDTVSGYPVGIRFSEEYTQSLVGGTWNNEHNIEIANSIQSGRTITITNPAFVPSTDPSHYDIFWLDEFSFVYTRDINAFFGPDTVLYNGNHLFAPWQAADYIPFPQQPTGAPALPAALIGLSNRQLFLSYGLAIGGILPPAALPGGPVTNGTAGAVATYPTVISLVGPYKTSQLLRYQLQYQVAYGAVQDGVTTSLAGGWNMFVIAVNGLPRTLFVLGLGSVNPPPGGRPPVL
jgi:hypothetical protein